MRRLDLAIYLLDHDLSGRDGWIDRKVELNVPPFRYPVFPSHSPIHHPLHPINPTLPNRNSPNNLKHSQATPQLLPRPRHEQDNTHEREALLEMLQEEEISLGAGGVGSGVDVRQGSDVIGFAAEELSPGLVGPEEFAALLWAELLLRLLPGEDGSGLGRRKRRCCVRAWHHARNRAGFVCHLGDEVGVETQSDVLGAALRAGAASGVGVDGMAAAAFHGEELVACP
jgi:hypothetical protein